MALTATQRLNIKLKILSISFNVVVFLGIAICSILFNKYIECVILFLSFIGLRYAFPKTYHSSSLWVCLFWSIMVFFIALPNVLPIHLSILFGIVIGCVLDFVLYKIQDYVSLKKFYDKHNSVQLETLTKEQIVELCKILKYKKDKIDLAIMFFVDKLSNQQVWEYLCNNNIVVEIDTVRQYRYRIQKDINRLIKT